MPVQTTFPETIKQGLPGFVNRMVDFNSVTRTAELTPIPPARAVSQSTTSDGGAILGGTLVGFLGISLADMTIVATDPAKPDDYPRYTNIGILTKGEIFAQATVPTTAGDPVHFIAVDGVLTNTGGIGPVAGARWKHTRLANELNVVQLGIQR